MQNKLQELTEKIYKEGLAKGTEEAAQIVGKAKEDASKIIANATKEAEQIVAQAKKQADDYKKNVETEVAISARQVVNGLKQDLSALIEAQVIKAPLMDALKEVEFIKKVIETAIQKWDPNSLQKISLQVLVPEVINKELIDYLKSKSHALINKEFVVVPDKNIKYGFRIGPKDGSYIISFTEKDFENLFTEYMRPRIVELLLGGK